MWPRTPGFPKHQQGENTLSKCLVFYTCLFFSIGHAAQSKALSIPIIDLTYISAAFSGILEKFPIANFSAKDQSVSTSQVSIKILINIHSYLLLLSYRSSPEGQNSDKREQSISSWHCFLIQLSLQDFICIFLQIWHWPGVEKRSALPGQVVQFRTTVFMQLYNETVYDNAELIYINVT